jgi:hypothetical protein
MKDDLSRFDSGPNAIGGTEVVFVTAWYSHPRTEGPQRLDENPA